MRSPHKIIDEGVWETPISKNGQGENAGPNKSQQKIRWPKLTLDLNQSRHRRIVFFGFIFIILGGSATLVGGYQGIKYMESSDFCGTTCHTMAPQYSRYEVSPHANVECVACHVGPGADHFIQSKIQGLRQVYALLTDSYNRPIKSPIADLRPAQDTCETCHAPTTFKDNIIKSITHFDSDAGNTLVQSTLILKMGGWEENGHHTQGIHWHVNNPVYYIAQDEQRQNILWVGVEQDDGSLKEYFARDMLGMAQTSFVETAFANDEVRQMDCIDCHNRASHDVPPPDKLVDQAIETKQISQEIPYIRKISISLLEAPYSSKLEAYSTFDDLVQYYKQNYPSDYARLSEKIIIAIGQIKNIYDATNFPEMALDWKTNPNNQQHTNSLGCFRCHDDKHVMVDEDGDEVGAIRVECNLCHTVPIVGRGENLLVEAPVIVGPTPPSHADFSWTIEHRDVPEAEQAACFECHGNGFCNNGVCHNLDHPEDMLFSHPEAYRLQGDQTCYTCHQNISCSGCHPDGVVENP